VFSLFVGFLCLLSLLSMAALRETAGDDLSEVGA